MSDRPDQAEDRYAKEFFTFRGMTKWQLWWITVASAAIVVALLIYAWS